MSDDDSRAQKLVNITLTNYFKQRALEVEETGKPPQSAVSPAESAVFNECRDQALTRGIAGSFQEKLRVFLPRASRWGGFRHTVAHRRSPHP